MEEKEVKTPELSELIKKVNNKEFKFVRISVVNPTDKSYESHCTRLIRTSDTTGFVSTHSAFPTLKITRKWPTENTYKMFKDGYLEFFMDGRHPKKVLEILFLHTKVTNNDKNIR